MALHSPQKNIPPPKPIKSSPSLMITAKQDFSGLKLWLAKRTGYQEGVGIDIYSNTCHSLIETMTNFQRVGRL